MLSQPVRNVMDGKKLVTASPEATVGDAARLMADRNVGAILIVQDARLIGIFTERDALFRVIAQNLDASSVRLADVMTPEPQTVGPDKPFGYALVMMQESGFRHAPVVENGKPIGIVSSRLAFDPDLEEFESEAQRRKQFR